MRQQVRHLARVRTHHDRHCVAGECDRIGHDDVQRGPAAQLHQLLRLSQARGSAGGEDQDVQGHGERGSG